MEYLDSRPLLIKDVRYGSVGLFGDLGYEGHRVQVQGEAFHHAISAHAPSRLVFDLEGGYAGFSCQVALNDDVPHRATSADFSVLGDGRLLAQTCEVTTGQGPIAIQADVSGVHRVELVITTRDWIHCHTVWLDPWVSVDMAAVNTRPRTVIDALKRAQIILPSQPIQAERCIATVVSPGFSALLDAMLGSLYANGECPTAAVVVFAVDADEECRRVVAKYGAHLVLCQSLASTNTTVKSILYSVAQVVDAEQFLCLDADTLIFGDLNPLFAALDVYAEDSILAAPDPNVRGASGNLLSSLHGFYQGSSEEMAQILGGTKNEDAYSLVVNDGVFAGNRRGLLTLERRLRAMLPHATDWMASKPWHGARNQFLFNLALATLECGVALDPTWNLLSGQYNVDRKEYKGIERPFWNGRTVRIMHFAGAGRGNHKDWANSFTRRDKPLTGDGDGYAAFLTALRAWIARRGMSALAWSFHGATNARDAYVRDPDTFPLLATLHYLIRSNGCERVLEAGTGRGVSTACLASAVAHRLAGRVVTLDHEVHAERADLWAGLPEHMQSCIEARQTDSLVGMDAAIEAGERYQAALLDSSHEGGYVWEEFQKVVQLVCEGGLILIHDVRYVGGSVEQALQQIEAAGYGVVRLWTAVEGIREDDHLGLAIIENRKRSLR